MNASPRALALIHAEEGCRLRAYWDAKGQVWTIGWGNTRYEDGRRVQKGDEITQARADALCLAVLEGFARTVDDLTTDAVSQVQFDALLSLVYNIGPEAYRTSTVRRLVNANPNDPLIREAWSRWRYAAGDHDHPDPVLVRRRARELDAYFSEGRPHG